MFHNQLRTTTAAEFIYIQPKSNPALRSLICRQQVRVEKGDALYASAPVRVF